MDILSSDTPFANQPFTFSVVDGIAPVSIVVMLGNERFYTTKCPDPPCHETVQIPDAIGVTLTITATDAVGKFAERMLKVVSPSGTSGARRAA